MSNSPKRNRSIRRQRGTVSVEAALVTPILVLLALGGVHFGKVLMLRHKLATATDVATRSAAIAKVTDDGQVKNLVLGELGDSNSLCTTLTVQTTEKESLGVGRLEVETICTIDKQRFTSGITGFLGPEQLSVRVAMPL